MIPSEVISSYTPNPSACLAIKFSLYFLGVCLNIHSYFQELAWCSQSTGGTQVGSPASPVCWMRRLLRSSLRMTVVAVGTHTSIKGTSLYVKQLNVLNFQRA